MLHVLSIIIGDMQIRSQTFDLELPKAAILRSLRLRLEGKSGHCSLV
jgi:hypothetical protein